MKNRNYISYFSYAFMALAFMGAMTSCVNEDETIDNFKQTTNKEGLSVSPTVSGSQEVSISTRAGSVASLNEIALNTLDVFVEPVSDPGTILKQYHLVGTDNNPIKYNNLNKLADSWRNEGLEVGQEYNLYVAANNPLTTGTVADIAALKDLKFNEVEQGIALVNSASNNVTWNEGEDPAEPTSGNIYKLYTSESIEYIDAQGKTQKYRALTNTKEFMMDKVIKNWSPTAGAKDQTFLVELNRAAAKIKLNVAFDPDFIKSLTQTKKIVDGQETWVDKPAAEKVTIIGTPAWKFYNFAFGAPVFTPDPDPDPDTAPTAGLEVHNSDFNIFHNQSVAGGASFTITTYTYPNTWKAAEVTTKAPSLVVSIQYQQGEGESATVSTNYYRIPIVPTSTTSIDRNNQYVINATIATRGSESHEDVNEVKNVYYEVTSWNNEGGEDQQTGDIKSIQNYYLQVSPKFYTLHGDDDKELKIHFSRAKNTSVDYKLFTLPSSVDLSNNTPVTKTAYDPDDQDAPNNLVYGWYFLENKNLKTSYTGLTNMGVTITNNNPGKAEAGKTEGTITVTSTPLPNRAIKYILLRVYLKDENDREKAGYYEDVLIRHFPTDNIQSAEGKWSSRTTSGWWSYGGYGTWQDDNSSSLQNVFVAKFYNNNNIYYPTNQQVTNLHNPYKYVIQLSSTSEQYVMGRPVLNSTNQSKDHVVSPAFMIASQLGATSSKQPTNNQIDDMAEYAAEHCSTYKEVDVTGAGEEGKTLWSGWRLPTREEIGVILRYQNADYDTMDPVLTGRFYWTLEGAAVATGVNDQWATNFDWYDDWETRYQDSSNDYTYGTYWGTPARGGRKTWVQESTFIRCIRDLSAEEIEYLNKWETIRAKFQAK